MKILSKSILIVFTLLFLSEVCYMGQLIYSIDKEKVVCIENSEEGSQDVEKKNVEEKYFVATSTLFCYIEKNIPGYYYNFNFYVSPFIEIHCPPPNSSC